MKLEMENILVHFMINILNLHEVNRKIYVIPGSWKYFFHLEQIVNMPYTTFRIYKVWIFPFWSEFPCIRFYGILKNFLKIKIFYLKYYYSNVFTIGSYNHVLTCCHPYLGKTSDSFTISRSCRFLQVCITFSQL